MDLTTLIYTLAGTIYLLAIIGLIAVIISENRSPVRALPWIMVILLVPGFGVILYLHFGVNVRHIRLISNRSYKRLTNRSLRKGKSNIADNCIAPHLLPLTKQIRQNSHAFLTQSYSFDLISSGQEYICQLEEAIRSAHHHIHLQGYNLHTDHTGLGLAQLLCQKAKEGVEVRVLYDRVGSRRKHRKFRKRLFMAGVDIRPFMKIKFPFLAGRVNYRNHRKIVVVDGVVGFMGNMDPEDRFIHVHHKRYSRALQIRLTGTAVWQLQQSFLVDWHIAGGRRINAHEYYPIPQEISSDSSTPMQITTSSPCDTWNSLEQSLSVALLRARNYILIETSVLIPTEQILQSLISAAMSGVEVCLIIPRYIPSILSRIATYSFFEELIRSGVQIFQTQERFTQMQYGIIDGQLSIMGTTRPDFRCFENNFEINAFIYSSDIAQLLEKRFKETQANAIPICLQQVASGVRYRKLITRTVRLLTPLL